MKKLLCLLLVLALAVTMFAACGQKKNDNDPDKNDKDPSDSNDESESVEEEEELPFELKSFLDENGRPVTYRMLVRPNRYQYLYFNTPNDPDAVYQQVYERNLMLEEMFGIEFDIVEPESDNAASFKKKLETIDETVNNLDLVCWDFWWALEQDGGHFMDLSESPEITTTDEWWYDGWNRNVTINGKQFSIAGDAALEVLQNLEVLFYNKQHAEANELELYDLVDDKLWTVEKMMEINTQVSQNLDDDDKTNDYYGALYDVHSMRSALFSAGLVLTTVEGDGTVSINTDITSVVASADAVTALINSREVDYSSATARNRDYSLFKDQNSLFFASCLLIGKDMKAANMDFDFGVLPMPMLREGGDYISTSYGASIFSIPSRTADPERAAYVLNAMNYFSNIKVENSIVYTFYEQVIKGRVADMPEDAQMIDIARESLYFDFAFVNEAPLGLLGLIQNGVVGNTSSATSYGQGIRGAQQNLTKLLAVYYE